MACQPPPGLDLLQAVEHPSGNKTSRDDSQLRSPDATRAWQAAAAAQAQLTGPLGRPQDRRRGRAVRPHPCSHGCCSSTLEQQVHVTKVEGCLDHKAASPVSAAGPCGLQLNVGDVG